MGRPKGGANNIGYKTIPKKPVYHKVAELEGRPYSGGRGYNHEAAKVVCERLMTAKSLREVCEDPRLPTVKTVFKWLADEKNETFREMYYYARRVQAEYRIDEIFEIADNTSQDWMPKYDADGNIKAMLPDKEVVQRSRERIGVRKWYASKMIPKLYGEKVQQEHSATGDLAALINKATDNAVGLPKPVKGEVLEHEPNDKDD